MTKSWQSCPSNWYQRQHMLEQMSNLYLTCFFHRSIRNANQFARKGNELLWNCSFYLFASINYYCVKCWIAKWREQSRSKHQKNFFFLCVESDEFFLVQIIGKFNSLLFFFVLKRESEKWSLCYWLMKWMKRHVVVQTMEWWNDGKMTIGNHNSGHWKLFKI